MRGIAFPAKERIEIWDDLVLPEMTPEDIEVRTTRSGVTAGTEKNCLLGLSYSPGFPMLPGYQQVGRVARAGSEVTRFAVGQRVYAHAWGKRFPSHPDLHGSRPGSHVEARVGKPEGNIMALPDSISDDEAALLSVASIGMHAVRRASTGLGQKVLVLGLGIIGQFACQAARALGARAFGVDQVPLRLEKAQQIACEAVANSSEPDLWGRLAPLGPFDVVIETTGRNEYTEEILRRAMVPRGSIVMVGGRYTVEYPFIWGQAMEVAILHTGHHTNEETAEVIRLHKAGLWQIAPLITHHFKPSQVHELWQMILGGTTDWLGIVYDWEQPW